MKDISHSPKVQDRDLTIWWFIVISRKIVGGWGSYHFSVSQWILHLQAVKNSITYLQEFSLKFKSK